MTIDIDAIRNAYETHRGEIHDNEGRRVFCCDGCALAEHVPALCDELEKLRAELDKVRAQMDDARYSVDQVLAKRDEALAELDKVRAQLADTQKRAHTDATNLQQILRDKTALANENLRLREQVFAQKPVIEAAEAWAELRDEEGITLADTRKADAALFDAIEQYRLMDMALTSARDEAEVAR